MKKLKMNRRIIGFLAGGLLVLVFVALYLWYKPPNALLSFLINQRISKNQNLNLTKDDGLYVITTGTGAPLPEAGRVGPQTIVIAGDEILVFDAGPGSTLKIELTGIDVGEVDALFLTHFHLDHIGDIGELMLKRWAGGSADKPLPVYGPPGVHEVTSGFETAYKLDSNYRVAHHGEEIVPSSGFGFDVHQFDLGSDLMSSDVIYSKDDLTVTSFNVDHYPVVPAVGYRVEYKDRSVVITGDTVYTDSLVNHSKDTDLLVSEALSREITDMIAYATRDVAQNTSKITEDIQTYHITPGQAGDLAKRANVSQLLITHLLPPLPVNILVNKFKQEIKETYSEGAIYIANDGTMVRLPVDSDEITITELIN